MGVKIKINGREISAEPGQTILQVALANGIYIPHFCYHPRLKIRGSCRMCLVEIEKNPKLQISCATQVQEGMVIETHSPEVKKARQAVLEFMLKNHPIDCPICDKAGECTLQDYYMEYDAKPSRLSPLDAKVNKGKRLIMGPSLVLDQERCIICHRCIRFMREVAKDDCLTDARRGDRTIITTFPGEEVNNPYSLNLTDICPVGAWTGRDFRFKKRVWFLTKSPSICPVCARGCNIEIDHENGIIYRLRPRENEQVNQSWMCDEGRLAYKLINENRLIRALKDKKELSINEALDSAVRLMNEHKGKKLGLISASASQEQAKAFKGLVQGIGGELRFYRRRPGEDDFLLRKGDRDSNLAGIKGLGIEEMRGADIIKFELLVVLESLYSEQIEPALGRKTLVLSPKRSEMVESSVLALPIASYAEDEGTYVNFEGKEQRFYPALELKGDSRPGLWVIKEMAKKLGLEI